MPPEAQRSSLSRPRGGAADAATPPLRVTCWGTRGSIPTPGPATTRFGGNTSCVEVRTADDACLIFDGGTGIRVLGRRLAAAREPVRAELFLTHFHWDHIQGVPFFAPLYDARTVLRIHGARQDGVGIRALFAGQMVPTYFPVPYEALAATLDYTHLDEEPWYGRGAEVAAMRVRHPGSTYGYRIRAGGRAVAYVPDNELVGGSYPVGPAWRRDFVAFLDGVDVLVHDAMFTDAEYPAREGWGHSTFRQAIALAEEAGVRRLLLFHHAPERTDAELEGILDSLREELTRRGVPLEVAAAAEGESLDVGAMREPAGLARPESGPSSRGAGS